MSLLSRFATNRHLDDNVLVEIWVAAAGTTDPHLVSCAHCRARYAALAKWLDEIRTDAVTEAEEALPAERLAAQQAQILRRLEALERPAKIITFPRVPRTAGRRGSGVPRWVPTAAAAGLVIGLATGQLFNLSDMLNRLSPSPAQPQVENASRPLAAQPANPSIDEAIFYGDAELTARTARYLSTLDELTPRARDEFDRPR